MNLTNEEKKNLIERALEARKNAYAPYSEYKVGACLITADGKYYTGCNVENASYGATNCAERTAVFKAVSEGVKDFKAIAVAGSGNGDFSRPCTPCGACLQVLSEFCGDDMVIVLSNGWYRLADFLPMRFTEESMK